jgi:hypothetical protein
MFKDMNVTKCVCKLIAGSVLASWMSLPLCAQTVKEGSFNFDICQYGKADYPRQARWLAEKSFRRIAASIRNDGQNDNDQNGSRCETASEVVGGEYRDHGVCTRRDADGDEWTMHYQTGADLDGTWIATSGSGKYAGIAAKGEYAPVNSLPGVTPNGFKNCNHYSGTYKLQ